MKPYHWVLIGVGVLFFAFVWPTPYQIYKHPRGGTYRVNRFTGVTESATHDGWKKGYVNSTGVYTQ